MMRILSRVVLVFFLFLGVTICGVNEMSAEQVEVDYDVDAVIHLNVHDADGFFEGTTYDPNITTPKALLGQTVGTRLAHHHEIIACFKKWSEESLRVDLKTYAKSYEGRELIRVVITSEKNMANLDQIKSDIARLSDPRGLDAGEAARIIAENPAIGWIGYNIHGDEMSGADASLAVGYHLIAGTSSDVTELLRDTVIILDPVMNPDGRERTISYIDQSAGFVPNHDYASMHRSRWPGGRGNHYLFNMNRDWIAGICQETRGRWKELLEFNPQLVVDVHEMGALDTFLFYPAAEPYHPNQPPKLLQWQKQFAADQAAAFDAKGWSYYTREWADSWYPGYSDSWSSLNGAIGILYEQAGLDGQTLRRPSGQLIAYDSSVRAQAVSSLSNLKTLARHREGLLTDYLEFRKSSVSPKKKETFAFRPGRTPDREQVFVETLLRQGIEVYRANEAFKAKNAFGTFGVSRDEQVFSKGTYLIPSAQPQGALVRTLLDLDPRLPEKSLYEERRELEKKNRPKTYDVTAWDLAHAFDLDGYWIASPEVSKQRVVNVDKVQGGITRPNAGEVYAWVVDGRDDSSVTFAVAAIEHGVQIHVAEKGFTTEGKRFPRGSLLIRQSENAPDVRKRIEEAAKKVGVQVHGTTSGRSPDEGPDLGGQQFILLSRPRVAVLTNAPISSSDYGHVWYQLDTQLKVPFTLLDIHRLNTYDLRRYNVIIIPPADTTLGSVLTPHAPLLNSWVRGGGTLIAIGASAAALTGENFDFVSTRLRRDALLDIEGYEKAANRELASRDIKVDSKEIWGDSKKGEKTSENKKGEGEEKKAVDEDKEAAEQEDLWERRFSPYGAILRGLMDLDDWLTYGCAEELPVMFTGQFAYLSRFPVETPVRLASAEDLRLSGLLWPEAAKRLATTAYVTAESVGWGQVILFASPPSFRAYFRGTARLLANAVVYGPSLGASQPIVW